MNGARVKDADGLPVSLGARLGGGGEGNVFALSAQTAVKLYAAPPTPQRVRKLEAMVALDEPALRRVAAWPLGTLHEANGRVCGFAMQRIEGRTSLAAAMNPASRKLHYPHATWAWLAHVARNVSAVVQTLHDAGVVIGDVNESNFLVGADTFVRAIDVDSFQVTAGRDAFTCDVAVAAFQPPELQGRSFAGVVRTPNHDRFGLALLVFQLLFMGRHPWAGVRSGPEIPFDTGEIIARLPFAFGRDAAAAGFAPPPNSVRMEWLPLATASMFERAFARDGAPRPAASEWIAALADFEGSLRPCGQAPLHRFVPERGACPWCALERRGLYLFIASPGSPRAPAPVYLDVAELRAQLDAIPTLEALPLPADPARIEVTAERLPSRMRWHANLWRAALAPGIGADLFARAHLAANWEFMALTAGLVVVFSLARPEGGAVRSAREAAVHEAERALTEVAQRWYALGDGREIAARRAKLEAALAAYRALPAKFTAERARLEADKAQQQLRAHLDQYLIEDARIGHVGGKRKALLSYYGIQTALDVVNDLPTTRVHGVGRKALDALFQWAADLQAGFRFRPEGAVDPHLLDALQRRESRERSDLERELRGGPLALKNDVEKRIAERERLRPEIVACATAVAQARADLAALRLFA